MKSNKKLIFILFIIFLFNAFNSTNALPPIGTAVSYQVFYDNLSPYGKWIKDDNYGYVWIPSSQQGFRPYFSNGNWVMTDYGTTWVSTYPWGWAPFHYGRWTHDDFYGWLWVPGTEWGPAWVVWRSGGDNIGWSPMQPGLRVSTSFSPDNYTPADWWIFIPRAALLNPAFSKSYKGAGNNINLVKSTTIMNNSEARDGVTYVTGPHASEYARATNQHVPIIAIKNLDKPGKAVVTKNEVSFYRPAVEVNSGANKPAPASFTRAEHAIGKASAVSSGGTTAKPSSTATKKAKTTKKH